MYKMKRDIIKLLITVAVLLCSVTASAYDFEVDGIYYNILSASDLTAEVTSGDNKYTGEIIIPETVSHNDTTYLVTGIGFRAFYECSNLLSIKLPETLTYIGTGAFQDCSSLSEITIPDNVTNIKSVAFDGCNLPVENNIIYAGNWAVGVTNKELPKYVIREGTKGLSHTFYQCINLLRVTFPQSLKYLCENSFAHCSALKEITLPDSIKSIDQDNFYCCRNLESITMSNSVTNIGSSAFYECSSLKDITWSENIVSLGPLAFYGCKRLGSIVLPENLDSIGTRAFEKAGGYISSLPKKTRVIDGQAFWEGPKFSYDFELPDSIETIGSRAFGYNDFDTITFPKTIKTEAGFYLSRIKTAIIKSPNIIKERLSERCNLSKIQDCRLLCDTTDLPDCYFTNCSTLVSVTLPDGLKRIGESFFENCTALSDVKIPTTVTNIDHYAFCGCTTLVSITIPDSVTSIGNSTFKGCTGLTSIHLLSETPPSVGSDNFTENQYIDITLYVPIGSLEVYRNADTWKNFWNIRVKNSYAVTYIVDGEEFAVDSVAYGSEIVLRDEPTKEGHTFSGWSEAPATMPAEDITITGSFVLTSINAIYANTSVKINNNGITLINANNSRVTIYSANGTHIINIGSYAGEEIILDKGVYIVQVGNKTIKVKL